jgi:hypothetical protein
LVSLSWRPAFSTSHQINEIARGIGKYVVCGTGDREDDGTGRKLLFPDLWDPGYLMPIQKEHKHHIVHTGKAGVYLPVLLNCCLEGPPAPFLGCPVIITGTQRLLLLKALPSLGPADVQ